MAVYRLLVSLCLITTMLTVTSLVLPGFADNHEELPANEETDTSEDDDDLSGFYDADDDADFGEEGGFGEIEVNLDDIDLSDSEPSAVTFGGFVKGEVDYSHAYDDPDYSKIRSTLNLNLDWRIATDWRAKVNWNGFYDYSYRHRGRDEFTDETLETYESESELRETFVDGGLTNWFRIKLGRQIIALGQSEASQITDVANPRDLRELGMVDLEDSRVPVTATKLSFLFGSLELNAVAIHEIRGNKMPSEGSEFDVLQSYRSPQIIIEDEETPESIGENTEYLFRLFKTFNGGDFGLMWADVYDDYSYLAFHELVTTGSDNFQLTLVPRFKRIKTYGFSANMVSGSWLFKTEVARRLGVAIVRSDIETQVGTLLATTATYDEDSEVIKTWREKNTHSGMFGVEYSGIQDTTISLEAVGERIEEYEEEENLSSKETSAQMVLVITYTALNETFDAQLFWIHLSDNNGDVYRVNLEYDIVDALAVSGGFINYEASDEDATVYNYRNNDRVFVSLKYSF